MSLSLVIGTGLQVIGGCSFSYSGVKRFHTVTKNSVFLRSGRARPSSRTRPPYSSASAALPHLIRVLAVLGVQAVSSCLGLLQVSAVSFDVTSCCCTLTRERDRVMCGSFSLSVFETAQAFAASVVARTGSCSVVHIHADRKLGPCQQQLQRRDLHATLPEGFCIAFSITSIGFILWS